MIEVKVSFGCFDLIDLADNFLLSGDFFCQVLYSDVDCSIAVSHIANALSFGADARLVS
jgi:hypothetical protein